MKPDQELVTPVRPKGRCGVDLTVKEYAAMERVDERTVRRWIAKGAIKVRRTPGGGIRIGVARSSIAIMTLADPTTANHDNA